jgi:hypothetical protein
MNDYGIIFIDLMVCSSKLTGMFYKFNPKVNLNASIYLPVISFHDKVYLYANETA